MPWRVVCSADSEQFYDRALDRKVEAFTGHKQKIDRLVTELKMSPAEAYSHLGRVLEGVNAVIGGFFQGERMEEGLLWRERAEEKKERKAGQRRTSISSNGRAARLLWSQNWASNSKSETTKTSTLRRSRNNVIFASAIDGWAFTVGQFASMTRRSSVSKRSVLEEDFMGRLLFRFEDQKGPWNRST